MAVQHAGNVGGRSDQPIANIGVVNPGDACGPRRFPYSIVDVSKLNPHRIISNNIELKY